ncbi:hypothetical protein K504DRAFT_29173 [Pleomassaria siparia CBS 279.74]|uniref:Uncharacterized protein n=1 Tax=Pleomassaria siparia CBS 279.74 TaxID=1314801 RepID=A0A6G1KSV0_9PLEO|nr:hypothetical protein K504DRAFT_29173 [Pleomassaria siparia CBS 279.74]
MVAYFWGYGALVWVSSSSFLFPGRGREETMTKFRGPCAGTGLPMALGDCNDKWPRDELGWNLETRAASRDELCFGEPKLTAAAQRTTQGQERVGRQ